MVKNTSLAVVNIWNKRVNYMETYNQVDTSDYILRFTDFCFNIYLYSISDYSLLVDTLFGSVDIDIECKNIARSSDNGEGGGGGI